MNRRGFLQAILASATAPYVVTTAGVLMPVKKILVPPILVIEPWQKDLLDKLNGGKLFTTPYRHRNYGYKLFEKAPGVMGFELAG